MKFSKFCGFTNLLFLSIGLFSDCQAFDLDKDLKFRLYTREQPDEFQSLNVSSISVSLFNPKRPTRIFTHGFLSSEPVLIRYKDAFLKLNDFNVICVDWIAGAKTYNYLLAKSRVQAVRWNSPRNFPNSTYFPVSFSDFRSVKFARIRSWIAFTGCHDGGT